MGSEPCRLDPFGSQHASKIKENKAFKVSNSESISLHAFVWKCVFGRRFDFRTRGLKLVEFNIEGTRTWGSTTPICSQEGFGFVDITLLTTLNAITALDPLLKFCPRQFLFSLNPIIFFLLLVRRQFSPLPKWGAAITMALATKSTYRMSTKLIMRMRTYTLRVFVLTFPSAFTRTKGFRTLCL